MLPSHTAKKPIQSNKQQIQPKPALKVTSSQDHNAMPSTMEAAHNIMSPMKTFPTSFYAISNMSGRYTICTDYNMQPVTHTKCKVPIEDRQ